MSKSVKIDKHVPLPNGRMDWSFAKAMEVGDSFLLPDPETNRGIIKQRLDRLTGYRFTTRKTEEGIRVWRIA